MHSLNYIIYSNEQAVRRAKSRALKRRNAEAHRTIKRLTKPARGV